MSGSDSDRVEEPAPDPPASTESPEREPATGPVYDAYRRDSGMPDPGRVPNCS